MTATVQDAPAETPAPPVWPEPDHLQNDDLQARTVAVLLDLVSAKHLPRASWTVCAVNPGTLRGQIYVRPGTGHDDLIRERVTAWAEVFDVDAKGADTDFPQFQAVARIDGVTVEIWGHIAGTALKAAV